MCRDGVGPGFAGDIAQHERDDDGVVRIADDWDEVRYEVDRQCEIAEEEHQPYVDRFGHCRIGGESVEQSQEILH